MNRRILAAAALIALGACEQSAQTLPFGVEDSVTRTVTGQGGTVSTPAGAAVEFPDGSLTGSVTVGISTTEMPAAIARAGAPASEAFLIEPVGTVLRNPATLELRFDAASDPSRAWLASIVSVVGGDVRTYGSSRVDLGTGLVRADIERLGVVAAVIPPAAAIFPVGIQPARSLAASPRPAALASADSIGARCGSQDDPCAGLTVSATQNLLDQVEDAAVVFPVISGGFRIGATSVTGAINASASLRIKFQSGQTAESVEVNALIAPTAGTTVTETANEYIFTNVYHRISGASDSESAVREEFATLFVPKSGAGASITIDRSFEIRATGGGLEPAQVTLTFPVTVH